MSKSLCSRLLLFSLVILALSTASFAQIGISVSFGPPALPVYTQPLCPAPGYLWVPGYWAWDPDFGDYYWVPGTWVLAPQVGYLWTPPWWGWSGGAYVFNAGYWGPTVGFYGGISYGFGYFGHGYEGGRWNNGQFYYNRSVNNINVTNIRNVYNVTVVNNNVNHVSYNGGPGGIEARPTAAEQAAERQQHIPPVEAQTQQVRAAAANQQLRASVNQGRPPIAATPKPGAFSGQGVVQAKAAGAPYHPPAKGAAPEANANRPAANEPARPANESAARPQTNVPRPSTPIHAQDIPEHSAPANPGASEAERQSQQRQQQLAAQQQQEHEKLQQQQEQDHQRMAQQKASTAQMQQMERQHQQQTAQMEQRHAQQQQQATRPAPPPAHSEPEKH